MAWHALGTLSPTYDWRAFDIPVINTSLFRIIHSWNGENPGRVMIRNLFSDGGSLDFLISYPEPTPQMFEFPLSPEIQAATLGVRELQIKMPLSARVYADTDWQVTIEEWL